MQKNQTVTPIRKFIPPLVATLCMTIFIGFAILAFGLNAFFNQNGSVAQAAAPADNQVSVSQANIQDMQSTISQYQAREAQYQKELQQAADQLNQANAQNLQYQQLFQALQNAGVIQLSPDGQVFISRGSGSPRGFDDDGN